MRSDRSIIALWVARAIAVAASVIELAPGRASAAVVPEPAAIVLAMITGLRSTFIVGFAPRARSG